VEINELETLADQGNVEAMHQLGAFYSSDEAGVNEYPTAIKYFKQAMALNHPPSFQGLARIYFFGLGVKKSYKRAYDLTSQAIRLGNVKSRLFFSLFYLEGLFVKKNLFTAYDLVYDQANKNDSYAQYLLGVIYLKLKKTKDAVKWLEISAKNGATIASRLLGQLYLEGKVVIQDQNLATFWFNYAINQGCQVSSQILKAMTYFKQTLFKVIH
jgi:TPR repeat protein